MKDCLRCLCMQTKSEADWNCFHVLFYRALWDTWLFSTWNTKVFNGWHACRLWKRGWSVSISFCCWSEKSPYAVPLLYLTCSDACVEQLGLWSDPFHLTGWLATFLAPQTDADAEDDHGRSIPVQLPRVGWQVWHCERPGKQSGFCS